MTKTKVIAEGGNANEKELAEDEDERDDDNLVDTDSCSESELQQAFRLAYRLADESVVSLKKDYVLSLSHNNNFTQIAAGLSNGQVKLFDLDGQGGGGGGLVQRVTIESNRIDDSNNSNVCGVKFLRESGLENCLLVGSSSGAVKLFDIRTDAVVATFQENPNHSYEGQEYLSRIGAKPITCFDCNANERIICTGTEQFENNVFLIFYDVRERKQLGGYYESHQDDVTTVRFHDSKPDLLASGSTDGLINIFDIQETMEDDSLKSTINTESSVHKLNWHKSVNDKDIISCITHTNDFMAYEVEEGDQVAEFQRQQITERCKRTNSSNCNLINAHNDENGSVFLLVGTNYRKGEILRSLLLQGKELEPLTNFSGNKQIIRESLYNNKCLITAGESGIVSLWTPQAEGYEAAAGISEAHPTKSKKKSSKRSNPY